MLSALPSAAPLIGQVVSEEALALGASVQRTIRPGDRHSYRLTLDSGQFVHIGITQQDVDVTIEVFDPQGRRLGDIDCLAEFDTEPVAWAAEAAGIYRIVVRTSEKESVAGSFTARIVQLRPAAEPDRRWWHAVQASTRTKKLAEEFTTASLREAMTTAGQARDLWQALGERRLEAQAINSLAYANLYTGNHQIAQEQFEQALQIYRAIGNRFGEAETITNLGAVHSYRGDKRAAITLYEQALTMSRAEKHPRREGVNLINVAAIQYSLGELRAARTSFQRCVDIYEAIGEQRIGMQSLNGLAAAEVALGNKQRALTLFQRALPIARGRGELRGEATILANVGVILQELGDPRSAIANQTQALSILDRHGDPRSVAAVNNSLGASYLMLEQPNEALSRYSRAIELWRSVKDVHGEAGGLNSLGRVHEKLGDHAKAFEYRKQALELFRQVGDRRYEAVTQYYVGAALVSRGEYTAALPYLLSALEISTAIGDRTTEIQIRYHLARVHRHNGDLATARHTLEPAIEIIESTRASVIVPELRASYFAVVLNLYKLYIAIQMDLHRRHPDANHAILAYEAAERSRARALFEVISESRTDSGNRPGDADVEAEIDGKRKIRAAEERRIRLLSGKHTSEQDGASQREIETLLHELRQIQDSLLAKNPRYTLVTQPQPLSLQQIQDTVLDSETLLLTFSLGSEASYLWVVTSSTLESFVLPKRLEIEGLARKLYQLVTARHENAGTETWEKRTERVGRADSNYSEVARALSLILLRPISARLGYKRVAVVSDGALQYIPLGALPLLGGVGRGTADDKPVALFMANHDIVYLPSASSLAALRRESRPRVEGKRTLAVFADPVFEVADPRVRDASQSVRKNAGPVQIAEPTRPKGELQRSAEESGIARGGSLFPRLVFSRKEANAILGLVKPEQRMGALDFSANRDLALGERIGEFRIIHFATHALANDHRPELAGIVLSLVNEGGREREGFVSLRDVYNLKLNADLAVLSACQTALGPEIKGEGLIGLTRAFMYAGAPRVVASQWRVDDEATAELMKQFYTEMLGPNKLRPAAALSKAQGMIRQQKRWRAPYYWAGFVLHGDWR